MSELGPIKYDSEQGNVFLGRDYTQHNNSHSGQIAYEIDVQVRKIIDECYAQAKEIILDCIDVKEIQCIALELKQINKCSLLFSADARSKFDLKDVPSEEMITIFVSEMAVSSMTSSVFFTGFRVEMDVPKARILHTQICKNIPMRAYYFDQKTHRRVSTSF